MTTMDISYFAVILIIIIFAVYYLFFVLDEIHTKMASISCAVKELRDKAVVLRFKELNSKNEYITTITDRIVSYPNVGDIVDLSNLHDEITLFEIMERRFIINPKANEADCTFIVKPLNSID